VAWIQRADSTFFPPDAVRNGIDLASLVVVHIPAAPPGPARGSAAKSDRNGQGKGGPGSGRLGNGGPHNQAATIARAATRLLRSGAFGLVMLDLGSDTAISAALLGKLGQLAQRHDTAVCCLTVKRPERPSLGSLVSLRGEAVRCRTGEDRFSCVVRVLKDKRSGPGWTHEEVAHGAPGLP
jgi:recombination protein RecA